MTALRGALGLLRRVCSTLTGATGFAVVAIVLVAAVFAPWIATTDPDKLDVMNRFAAPSAAHWLGTDHLGRDLYSRLVHGSTVAINALIQQKGAVTGLLTTDGFEDTLEIGRHKRSRLYELLLQPETPAFLAPRR